MQDFCFETDKNPMDLEVICVGFKPLFFIHKNKFSQLNWERYFSDSRKDTPEDLARSQ